MSDSNQPGDSSEAQDEANTTSPAANSAQDQAGKGKAGDTDYHDHKDATPKEMLSYGLFSIVDEFAMGGYDIMTKLLSIGFGVSPLVAGFMGGIRTLWDGIADPIMAYVSDNTRSRWGRRRPYIFIGCILMAIASWATWAFIPNTGSLEPNTPVVPVDQLSDAQHERFGKMLLGYATPLHDLTVTIDLPDEAQMYDTETMRFAKKAVKDLGSASKNIVNWVPPKEESEDSVSTSEATEEVAVTEDSASEEVKPPHFFINVEMVNKLPLITQRETMYEKVEERVPRHPLTFRTSLSLSDGTVLSSDTFTTSFIDTPLTLEPQYKGDRSHDRQINFLTKRVYDIIGEPEEIALNIEASDFSLTTNIYAERAMQQALYSTVQNSIVRHIGDHYGLPYWRILQHETTVSDEAKSQSLETFDNRLAADPNLLRYLGFAAEIEIDLMTSPDEITEKDKEKLSQFAQANNISDSDIELAHYMWENNNAEVAAGRIGLVKNPLKTRGKKKGAWEKITAGFSEITGADEEQFHLIIFILAMFMIMATAGTIYGAPFYAYGIEIAPSYHGRTKVVVYRAWFQQAQKIIMMAFPILIMLPIFYDAAEGGYILSTILLFVAIAASVVPSWARKSIQYPHAIKRKKPGFFRAFKEIGSIPEFWRVTGLYLLMGQINGMFNGLSTFIVTYYVFGGNILQGFAYGQVTQVIALILGFAQLPLIQWLCGKLGKHVTLRLGLAWLIIGSFLKFWVHDPDHPELLWILPFFYSVGIATFYTVLQTLMGDVTDIDELRNGERREAMFGAVMAVIMKSMGAVGAITSGIAVVASGFEISKGVYQDPGVFTTMLWWFSIFPGCAISVCFILLWRYPLTKERMAEVKEELAVLRKQRAEQNAQLEAK